MSRSSINFIMFLLAAMTVAVLVISLSEIENLTLLLSNHLLELVIYALLTAFAIALSVPLARSEFSIAHAIGITAFLSLPATVFAPMTIAVAAGAVIGSLGLLIWGWQPVTRLISPRTGPSSIYIVARVTLSFFVSGRLYISLSGQLPLDVTTEAILNNLIPLVAYGLSYVVLYFAIFVLQLYAERQTWQEILTENLFIVSIILLLPLPFAFMAAEVARSDESLPFFSVTIIGAALIIFGLHVLSRSEQRLRRQLAEMQSLSVATGALRGNLDLPSLLQTTYDQVSNLLDIRHFVVGLQQTDGSLTYALVKSDNAQHKQPGIAEDRLIQHVLKTGTVLRLDRNQADMQTTLPGLPAGMEGWLGVPVVATDRITGVFAVASDERSFTDNDHRLLKIIVASAGIAIENARLYSQKSERAEQLTTLNQVLALLTETLAPGEVLDTIASSASMVSDANAVAVYLYRDDDRSAELVRHVGLSDAFAENPPQPMMMAQNKSKTRTGRLREPTIIIRNIMTDDHPSSLRQVMNREGKRALVELPLTISDHNAGIIVLYFNEVQILPGEQIDLLEAFATQAAQAIKNARTFALADEQLEHRVEQLYVLAAMGRLLTATLETTRIYEIVLEYATEATDSERGLIVLRDAKQRLSIPAAINYPDEVVRDPSFLSKGIAGQVMDSGQAFRTGDTHQESGYLPLVPGTRSLILTPIIKGRDVMGVILLESDNQDAFSRSDSHFVAQMAYQAVVAADNTRLFQRIRETRDNLQVILNATEEGFILINREGNIALANPGIHLIGLDPDTIMDQRVLDLLILPELDFGVRLGFVGRERLHRLLDDLQAGTWKPIPAHSYELPGERGTCYIQRQIIPIEDDNRELMGVLLVFYDKSEEYELERARESFSQMTVHDLRSPLTAVTTSLRLLNEIVPSDSEVYPMVVKITEASRRAIRKVLSRVNALLDISRMESGEMQLEREPTALYYMIDNIKTELSPLAEDLNVQIETSISPSLPLLNIDADKVERMLLNLVDNALKYAPRDSTITLRAHETDEFLHIEVIDEGPGVPDDYKNRLFERYVQVEGRRVVRQGVGLGLTFCKLVSDSHGGDIWIADNPAGGSIFNVTLPVARLEQPTE